MHKLLLPAMLLLYTATYAQPVSAPIDTLLKQAKQHIHKPGENKIDLDSAATLIKQAETLNAGNRSPRNEGYILLIYSYLLNESGQKDKAKETVTRAVELLKDGGDKNLAGEAYMTLSGYYSYNDLQELAQRIDLVKLAVSSYEQSGNTQHKAASLQMLGDLYSIRGSYHIALQHLQEALTAYNSINYPQVQGIYSLMGFQYSRLREYRKGLDMHLLALRTAEATGDSSMQLCQIYNNLAETIMALNDKQKALHYYQQALRVAQKHNDNFASYLATVNIGHVWVAINQPYEALALLNDANRYGKPPTTGLTYNIARCYIGSYSLLKQFEKARPYVKQLQEMANSDDLANNAKLSCYAVITRFYIAAGEYKDARKYILKHDELANQLKDLYHMGANQRIRFVLDTARRDYKTAVTHLLEFNRLNDSLSLESKSRQIDELQVQYETEKKEQAIVAKDKDIQLLTRQSLLQQSRIDNARLLRNFMIVGAALLCLIVALLYRAYIVKKKNNQVLSKQRSQINEQNISLQAMIYQQEKLIGEKEWLLKEIHHRVKNNLQIVMSLLNSQSKFIDNNAALTAIHDSQHRVHAMSLIHQKLYGSENLSSINMSFYIREMAAYLADSFDMGQRIRFEYSIEPLELDVSQAVPLGLILNEAITNSIKYAFPNDRNGIISIALTQTGPHQYLLSIADNGAGIPVHLLNKKTGSLGMSLMKGLSKNLDGHFSIENNNGTIIKILFTKEPGIKSQDALISPVKSNPENELLSTTSA